MRRWSGIAGIVFVVLAVASRLVEGSKPDTSKSNAVKKLTSFYADHAHQDRALAAAVIGFVGLFFFVWFLAGIWSAMRNAEGVPTARTGAILAGGTAFFVFGGLSHLFANVVGATLQVSDAYRLDPNSAILVDNLAFVTFALAMIGAGVMAASTGLVILRTRVVAVWLAWIGFAIAVLALPVFGPLTFLAAVLLAVWVLVLSVVMIRTPGEVAVTVVVDSELFEGPEP